MGRFPGGRSLDAAGQFPNEGVGRQHRKWDCGGSVDAPCDCLIDIRPSRWKLPEVTRTHAAWPQDLYVARQLSCLDLFSQCRP